MTRSAWWFLLPLVLGILGSAIAWSKLRNDDPELVRWIMYFGMTQTIALAIFGITGDLGDVGGISDEAISFTPTE